MRPCERQRVLRMSRSRAPESTCEIPYRATQFEHRCGAPQVALFLPIFKKSHLSQKLSESASKRRAWIQSSKDSLHNNSKPEPRFSFAERKSARLFVIFCIFFNFAPRFFRTHSSPNLASLLQMLFLYIVQPLSRLKLRIHAFYCAYV